MSCGAKFAKFIIGIVNLIILVAAIIVFAVCYAQLGGDGKEYYDLFKTSTAFLVFIAVLVFCLVACVVGFLLCCCKSKCWRVFYAILLTVVIVVEIAVVAVIYSYTDQVITFVEKQWNKMDSDPGIHKAVESAEQNLCCCGFNTTSTKDLDRCNNYTIEGAWTADCVNQSCLAKLTDTVNSNLKQFGIGGIVILVIEILLFIFTIYYACLSEEDVYEDITKI